MITKEHKEAMQKGRSEAREEIIAYSLLGVGHIEDVYGTADSFNIYSTIGKAKKPKFYKSAYSLEDAKRKLNELIK